MMKDRSNVMDGEQARHIAVAKHGSTHRSKVGPDSGRLCPRLFVGELNDLLLDIGIVTSGSIDRLCNWLRSCYLLGRRFNAFGGYTLTALDIVGAGAEQSGNEGQYGA